MKFVAPTKAEPLTNKSLRVISYGLGFWTTGLAVLQMISFEKFTEALQSYHIAGSRVTLVVVILLLAIEIFSVPFFFRLTLSPAARMASAILGIAAPYAWMALVIYAYLSNANVQNVGYFGGLIAVPLGNGIVFMINLVWMTLVTIGFGPLGGSRAWRAMVRSN